MYFRQVELCAFYTECAKVQKSSRDQNAVLAYFCSCESCLCHIYGK